MACLILFIWLSLSPAVINCSCAAFRRNRKHFSCGTLHPCVCSITERGRNSIFSFGREHFKCRPFSQCFPLCMFRKRSEFWSTLWILMDANEKASCLWPVLHRLIKYALLYVSPISSLQKRARLKWLAPIKTCLHKHLLHNIQNHLLWLLK